MPPRQIRYLADLTPSQRMAHERIEALQKVYDAAREVLTADEIWNSYPDDTKSQDRWAEAIGALDAVIWNTASILNEPYPIYLERPREEPINEQGAGDHAREGSSAQSVG